MNQDEIKTCKRQIISNEVEWAIKTYQQSKAQNHLASQINNTNYLRDNTYSSQTIPKNKEETHPDLFCEATSILLQKPDKKSYKKQNKNKKKHANVS